MYYLTVVIHLQLHIHSHLGMGLVDLVERGLIGCISCSIHPFQALRGHLLDFLSPAVLLTLWSHNQQCACHVKLGIFQALQVMEKCTPHHAPATNM